MKPATKTKAKKREPRLSERDRQVVAAMKEDSALLAEFGLELYGYDPGVTAYFKPGTGVPGFDTKFSGILGMEGRGYWGEPVALTRIEWKWLKPLLQELLEHRRQQKSQLETELPK